MPGLDPGTHSVATAIVLQRHGMDCRIKSGNDDSCWFKLVRAVERGAFFRNREMVAAEQSDDG